MSGTISGAPISFGLLGQLVADGGAVKDRLDALTRQAADGRVAEDYAGLGVKAKLSLDLRAELDAETSWSDGISAADGRIKVTQDAMTRIGSIASNLSSQLVTVDAATASAVAASARQGLQQLAGLLNTRNGADYVFAGQDAANAPVPDPGTLLSSPFVTQIAAQVALAGSQGAAATWKNVVAIAGPASVATSPFSPFVTQVSAGVAAGTQPAQAALASVEVGPGQRVPVGVLAGVNTGVSSAGPPDGTGSWLRDLMASLAAVASLQPGQMNEAGTQALVAQVRTSLGGTVGAISDQAGVLGVAQDRIDAAGSALADTRTALNAQISGLEDVDMASTLSELTQTQSQLQASYKLIANAGSLSLVNFL